MMSDFRGGWGVKKLDVREGWEVKIVGHHLWMIPNLEAVRNWGI